jgi:hypothetical protein
VPLTVAMFYKKKKYKAFSGTYGISALIIFTYPFIFLWLCSLQEIPEQHGICYNAEAKNKTYISFCLSPRTK